jgi:hypothetical protein
MMKKYETCSCNKEDQDMRCIYTGFPFVYNGWLFTSDLFLCEKHHTLSIHGSPSTALQHTGEAPHTYSIFDGFLINESGSYRQSGSYGILYLNQQAQDYVNRYHDLTLYEKP